VTDKTPLELERDSFIKQGMVALVANYWAHNRDIEFDEMVHRANVLVHKCWEVIIKERNARKNT
jgi:hypothetical protein